jgi:glycosyltransferase involved in cell wall biosynthesis
MQKVHKRTCPVVPNVWLLTDGHDAKADPPEVLWAARYVPLKRPEWVLEIAKSLPAIRFIMAGGPGAGQDALFSQIEQAAASISNVDVLGFVPFSEIDQYYARASALLCTSTVEGFPNTFLQAWNQRTPVVSTFDPDNVLARHGVGIPCKNIGELITGIQRACSTEGPAMGERCRGYLERVHSVEAVMAALGPLLAV